MLNSNVFRSGLGSAGAFVAILAMNLLAGTSSALAQQVKYSPPGNSTTELAWVAARKLSHVDEAYRAIFDQCDQGGCAKDKNNVRYLLRLEGKTPAILYQSKMALDLDGGFFPCAYKTMRPNQCGTSFRYDQRVLNQDYERDRKQYDQKDWNIPIERLRRYFNILFVTSDTVPYVVAPGGNTGAFSSRTKIRTGDVGVVVFRNIVVPVIVADRGPPHKLGEGSLKVFDDLGISRCNARDAVNKEYCIGYRNYSHSEGITTILFPNSTFLPKELTPDTINNLVRQRALDLYARLKAD